MRRRQPRRQLRRQLRPARRAAGLGGIARIVAVLAGVLGCLLLAASGPAHADGDGDGGAAGERRVVRVGTEGTYPPFSFHEAGSAEVTGYDIDVVKAVAERAGWELEFVETQWDAIFPALDAGRIDVIANQVSWNEERAADYGLSDPYTYSEGVIVTRADEDAITTLEDLAGRTTAQSATSNWAQVARDAGARVETVEGFAQAVALLAQGRVDAIVNDNIAVLDYLAQTGSEEVKIAGVAEGESTEQVLTFRQDDTELLTAANQALAELSADGTLAEISEKYFKADVSVEGGGGDVDVSGARARSSNWDIVRDESWPMIKGLLRITVPLTVVAFAGGLTLAVLVALARISSSRILAGAARAFISAIRGTPLLLQLFIVFYGLPQVGIRLDGFVAAALAFGLNVAGYAAEIVRSAILAVPKGQFEAAQTIGLDYRQTLRRIVFPQALRTAVPPLSNTLLSLLKDTSLVAPLLLSDITRVAQEAAGRTNEFLLLYAYAGLYYWIICTLLSAGQTRLEARLDRYVAK
ncbi:cystine transport system permease protein [Nocardioides sp. J9]|nr:cystine transport system permease protein [Nocardioides sp. J9]